MVIKELRLTYEEFSSVTECPDEIQNLFKMASEAAEKAYAPYSRFQVGVAVLLADGSRYTASNQENKAYPSGLCAERVVLFYVNGLKPDIAVSKIVLAAFENGELVKEPAYPCGSCRQVMMESEERGKQAIETWMIGQNRVHKTSTIQTLLPLKFSF